VPTEGGAASVVVSIQIGRGLFRLATPLSRLKTAEVVAAGALLPRPLTSTPLPLFVLYGKLQVKYTGAGENSLTARGCEYLVRDERADVCAAGRGSGRRFGAKDRRRLRTPLSASLSLYLSITLSFTLTLSHTHALSHSHSLSLSLIVTVSLSRSAAHTGVVGHDVLAEADLP
jgi:hypothetical protein